MKIIIVGSGVAGAEAGTYLGHIARSPLEIIEIECEPMRRFGGWGFQRFPQAETTNLALRKMYLGRDPEEILSWVADPRVRATWPPELRDLSTAPDAPIPRCLIQRYVTWRREQVDNPLVTYRAITGEAMRVHLGEDRVSVELRDGERVTGDRLIMASGSIAVKVPPFLEALRDHERVIIDPLTLEGHQHRAQLPLDARVLIVGTGLTGEEQANILYKRGHPHLTVLSRNGMRHYAYHEEQSNRPLILDAPPDFLHAETPEEFDEALADFYTHFLEKGHAREDILAAIRPFWDEIRAELGGCYSAAHTLRRFRRSLAVNSIGAPFAVAHNLKEAEAEGALTVLRGHVRDIQSEPDGTFLVRYDDGSDSDLLEIRVDVIINAVGRNIIRHPIWKTLLREGIAKKHAGIGVQVSETGQMISGTGEASDQIWVVGMARAGDHALRHGFLGNTAFNVPQVRAHLYDTLDAMLGNPCPHHLTKLEEVHYRLTRYGLDARLPLGEETPLIWAASEGYPEIGQALIEAGAALNAQNSRGNTALIRAACEGRTQLVQALIEAGADLDVQNDDGYTAVVLAKRRGYPDIVEHLLHADADATLTNHWGLSLDNPGHSPKTPLTGPRDATLEAQIADLIPGLSVLRGGRA